MPERWKEKEVRFLKEKYPNMTAKEIAKKLGRSIKGVQRKVLKLGLKKGWTDDEENFLRKNYNEYTNEELARILNVTENSIEHKAQRLGLKKKWRMTKDGWVKLWDNEEFQKLKEMRKKGCTLREIAETLNRPYSTIANYISKLGLPTDPAIKKVHERGREGEKLAKSIFEKLGMELVKEGREGMKNMPYDFIVNWKGESYALEVKHGKNMPMKSGQLNRLMKTGYKPLFMYIDMKGNVHLGEIKKVAEVEINEN